MKKLLERLRVHWNQNVIGRSPELPHTTWSQLKEAKLIGWDEFSPEKKQAKFKRLERDFSDETSLMFQTFMKLIGVLTPLGLVFAFGQDALKDQPLAKTLFAISLGMTTMWVIWGLSTRTKVFKRPDPDVGISTMMVDDGTGTIIEDEDDADVWWLYQWHWHRHHTRVGIDRLFFLACAFTDGTMITLLFI